MNVKQSGPAKITKLNDASRIKQKLGSFNQHASSVRFSLNQSLPDDRLIGFELLVVHFLLLHDLAQLLADMGQDEQCMFHRQRFESRGVWEPNVPVNFDWISERIKESGDFQLLCCLVKAKLSELIKAAISFPFLVVQLNKFLAELLAILATVELRGDLEADSGLWIWSFFQLLSDLSG